MFGYHDSNRCKFDIWSPVTSEDLSIDADSIQKGYGVWEDTPFNTAIENRAFSPFCKHTQECDDIVAAIARGETSFSLDDDFCQSDIDYINNRLRNEYGIYADLSLE
jgi:hypothetical protein